MSRESDMNERALYQQVFDLAPSRAQRRMVQILEAAIKNYTTIGIEATTYESIAKTCKVSRPLLQHYFKDKDEIFQMSMKYIRAHYQQYVIGRFRDEKDPRARLRKYCEATLGWVVEFPAYQRVWNLFYYYSSVNARLRKLNSELVAVGHQRITALVQEGADARVFAKDAVEHRAKQIQVLLMGAIITLTSEDLYIDEKRYREMFVGMALRLAVDPVVLP